MLRIPPSTHPLILVHTFKGVLGEWVLPVPQLCHHGIQQLRGRTEEVEKEQDSPPPEQWSPPFEPCQGCEKSCFQQSPDKS